MGWRDIASNIPRVLHEAAAESAAESAGAHKKWRNREYIPVHIVVFVFDPDRDISAVLLLYVVEPVVNYCESKGGVGINSRLFNW